jgi:hypothetical protein
MALPRYAEMVAQAVTPTSATRALAAAAVFDVDGKRLAVAGAVDDDEVRAIGMMIARPLQEPDPLARMLDGTMLLSPLDDRVVLVGIAARCVFVAAVLCEDSESQHLLAHELRAGIELAISIARADFSPGPSGSPGSGGSGSGGSGSGGSSSGPAELPVIEIGITVPRKN